MEQICFSKVAQVFNEQQPLRKVLSNKSGRFLNSLRAIRGKLY